MTTSWHHDALINDEQVLPMCRLFFLANNIPFTDELQPMGSWMEKEKERFTKEGLNPLGHLPVLRHEGRNMPETIAIARFLARKVPIASCTRSIGTRSAAGAGQHADACAQSCGLPAVATLCDSQS